MAQIAPKINALRCARCNEEIKKKKERCTRCKETIYCGTACLQKDKATHKEWCERVKLWSTFKELNTEVLRLYASYLHQHEPQLKCAALEITASDGKLTVKSLSADDVQRLHPHENGRDTLMTDAGYPDGILIILNWDGDLFAYEIDLVSTSDKINEETNMPMGQVLVGSIPAFANTEVFAASLSAPGVLEDRRKSWFCNVKESDWKLFSRDHTSFHQWRLHNSVAQQAREMFAKEETSTTEHVARSIETVD